MNDTVTKVVTATIIAVAIAAWVSPRSIAETHKVTVTPPYAPQVATVTHSAPFELALEPLPEMVITPKLEKQLDCLAANIYHEARGEPFIGQVAVARVVVERVESKKFPDTPCKVVYQRSPRGCQFSWVCANRKQPNRNSQSWQEAWQIAVDVYLNQQYNDVVPGALYFHSKAARPGWNKRPKVARIGNHVFYR